MPSRDRILEAAARVYGEYGFRGATTRRIATEAGVNEITVFRHFGSKEALIKEAIRVHATQPPLVELPRRPVDPERELTQWAASLGAHLRDSRSMISKCMSDLGERREMTQCIAAGPSKSFTELREYIVRLRKAGLADAVTDPTTAAAVLMGALFGDAMGRDLMPDAYPPASRAPASYARVVLRALGTPARARAAAAPAAPARSSGSGTRGAAAGTRRTASPRRHP